MHDTKGSSGLEGVVVADTALSDVDGERGQLVIAGERVEALAGQVPFEAVCARLWTLADGRPREPGQVRGALGQGIRLIVATALVALRAGAKDA